MIADDSTTLAVDRGTHSRQTRVWLAILVWSLFLRIPYLLHRMEDFDEGCHAAIATVLLDGGLPYRDVVDNKFPAVYYLYAAVFWVFGNYNMLAVHAVATLWTMATALTLARFAVSLGYRDAAPWTALFYCSFATVFPANLAANTEIFMNLPYAASVLALWHATSSRHSHWLIFLAGVLAGLATMFRQSAGILLAVQGFWLATAVLVGSVSWRRALGELFLFVAGFCAPLALMAWYFLVRGCYDDFVFWTLISVRKYLDIGSQQLRFGPAFLSCFLPSVVVGGVIWWSSFRWLTGELLRNRAWLGKTPAAQALRLVALWLVMSVAVTLTGKRMFPHYFLQYLPAMSLAAGMATSVWTALPAGKRWRRTALAGMLAPTLISWAWALVYPCESPEALTRIDPDFRPAVDYVKQTTQPSDRLFVWGEFTPLYVYTELKPGTRFVFTQIFVNYRPEYQAQDKHFHWPPDTVLAWVEIPEAWDMLEADFAAHPPELLLDTSPGNHHRFGPFPMQNFPRLVAILDAKYRHEATIAGVGIYRLKSSAEDTPRIPPGGRP